MTDHELIFNPESLPMAPAALSVPDAPSGDGPSEEERREAAIDLGSRILHALRTTGEIPADVEERILAGGISAIAEEGQRAAIAAMEDRYAQENCAGREKALLMYLVGFMLCGVAALIIDGDTFCTVEELAAWLASRCRRSTAAFTRACHRLLDENHLLDPQLEAWLIAQGRRQDVQKWQAEIDAGML